MNSHIKFLIQKYRSKGILLDTNLLLLYIVGSLDIEYIAKFKRTTQYTTDDFDIVADFLRLFSHTIVTPHILTEVSDFIDNRAMLQALLKIFIEKEAEEKFTASKEIIQTQGFIEFGLADTATIYTGKDSFLIFTDDNPLYGFLSNSKIDTVSLDQLRLI
jgi:hypothetical protein